MTRSSPADDAISTVSSAAIFRNVPTIGGPLLSRSRSEASGVVAEGTPGPLVQAEQPRGIVADHLAQIALGDAAVVELPEHLLERVDGRRVVDLAQIAADAASIRSDEIDPPLERFGVPMVELRVLVVHAALVLDDRAALGELRDLLAA